ncbi:MAG: hypothetical protein LEGION0398_MBIBDBAK_01277 [Legionellaceae bacterium]
MVNLAKEKNWSLSMTGHSLGGWLSQISLIYCHLEFDYKPNTVAFDSFGIGNMFDKLTERWINARTKPKEVDFDIKTYVASPNIINASHRPLGLVYQISPKLDSIDKVIKDIEKNKTTRLGIMGAYIYRLVKSGILLMHEDISIIQSITGHFMEGITDTFNPKTGFPYEIKEIIKWPYIKWPDKKTNYIEKTVKNIAHKYIDKKIADDTDPFKLLAAFVSSRWDDFLKGIGTKAINKVIKFSVDSALKPIFEAQAMESLEMLISIFVNPNVDKKAFRTFMVDFFGKKSSGEFSLEEGYKLTYKADYLPKEFNPEKTLLLQNMPHNLKGYNNKNINIMKFIKDSYEKGINFQENKKLHPESFALSYINYEYHEHDNSRLSYLECKEGCNSERLRATILRHCIFVHFQLKGNRLKNAKSDKEIQNGIIDNILPNFIDADINTSQSFTEEMGFWGRLFRFEMPLHFKLIKALNLYNEKKYSEARSLMRKLAKKGSSVAQYYMGVIFLSGDGVLPSDKRAFEWFKKSAEKENPHGQDLLGFMYAKGRGVKKDDERAVFWYQKAADQGGAQSQFSLGVMYANGRGVEKDENQAVSWLKKAAYQGHSGAQYRLGNIYYRGIGVVKNEKTAFEWFEKSANAGEIDAEYSLGYMYETGKGIDKNSQKAISWYQKAADKGHSKAQNNLGYMYQLGIGIPKDYVKAADLYQKAAEKDHSSAQYNLAQLYLNGYGVSKNLNKAIDLFKKSSDKGNAKAESVLKSLLTKTSSSSVLRASGPYAILADYLYSAWTQATELSFFQKDKIDRDVFIEPPKEIEEESLYMHPEDESDANQSNDNNGFGFQFHPSISTYVQQAYGHIALWQVGYEIVKGIKSVFNGDSRKTRLDKIDEDKKAEVYFNDLKEKWNHTPYGNLYFKLFTSIETPTVSELEERIRLLSGKNYQALINLTDEILPNIELPQFMAEKLLYLKSFALDFEKEKTANNQTTIQTPLYSTSYQNLLFNSALQKCSASKRKDEVISSAENLPENKISTNKTSLFNFESKGNNTKQILPVSIEEKDMGIINIYYPMK